MTITYADVEPGTAIDPRTYRITRLDLVKYCGASGDFNVIHWNERVARSVGLPNVTAHGMYTMAQAGKFVTEWAGDAGAVTDFGVRFSAMVPVPDDDQGATIEISGKVLDKLGDNKVTVDIVAKADGAKVLTRARATVRLPGVKSPGGATPRTPRCRPPRARWQKAPSYRARGARRCWPSTRRSVLAVPPGISCKQARNPTSSRRSGP